MKYIILVCLFALWGCDSHKISGEAVVTDGDTIQIGEHRIRFEGIDAPESDQICTFESHPYRCGEEATNYLVNMIGDEPVSCDVMDIDRYKRKLAICFNKAGEDLNAKMVSSGHAIAYLYYTDRYEAEHNEARANLRGIWRGEFMEPYQWRKQNRR